MKTAAPAEAKNGSGARAALERRCVNYVRVLSAEMVQAANSGHPGAPMGCAPMAHTLWTKVTMTRVDGKRLSRNVRVCSDSALDTEGRSERAASRLQPRPGRS